MGTREPWPLGTDGRALTVSDGLARLSAIRQFVEPFGFFGHEQLRRWILPRRQSPDLRVTARRAQAPSRALVRRVMCSMVVHTACHLAQAPHSSFPDSNILFQVAEGISRRVFDGYCGKVRDTQLDFMELAAARMSAMPDIFAATSSADCALVLDHLVVNPSCIFLREDGSQHTPLHKSARSGHLNLCKMFVLAGADVEATSVKHIKRTPLHDAALKGCTDVCRFLAEVGASVSARDRGDLTALHLAARKGHVDVCTCLVQGRADVEAKDRVLRTPLHCAASEGHLNVCEFLVGAGAEVDVDDTFQATPLHNAALNGHADICKFLVQARASPQSQTSDGRTPLQWAIFNEKHAVIEYLRSLDSPQSAQ